MRALDSAHAIVPSTGPRSRRSTIAWSAARTFTAAAASLAARPSPLAPTASLAAAPGVAITDSRMPNFRRASFPFADV